MGNGHQAPAYTGDDGALFQRASGSDLRGEGLQDDG